MERKLPQPGFWMAVALVLLVLGVQIVLTIPLGITDVIVEHGLHRPSPHLERQPFAIGCVNIVAFGAAIFLGLRLNRVTFRQAFPLIRIATLQTVGLVVMVLGADILLSDLDNAFRRVFPPPQILLDILKDVFFSKDSPLSKLFLLSIVAPLTEELLFRGIILRGLLSRHRAPVAITLAAFLFAALHLNPWQFLSALFLGIIFGWLYLRTGSLIACILAHAISNGLIVVLPLVGVDIPGFTGEFDYSRVSFQPWWLNLAGVVLFVAGLVSFDKAKPRLAEPPAAQSALEGKAAD